MQNAKLFPLGLILITCISLCGCGGSGEPRGEATGRVTLAGKPIAEGTLFFYSPELGWGQETPIVDSQFAITLEDGGLPPGSYKLAVLPALTEAVDENGNTIQRHKPSSGLPPHASDPASSGLTAEIQAGKNELQLDLSATSPRRSR